MRYNGLIFDLDGTLSDPKEGITKCVNYSLIKHGYEEQCVEKLAPIVIGPPLDESFKVLTNVTDSAHIGSLVTSYRERYADLGFRENMLYDGIVEILEQFKSKDVRMGVCTSKPERFAGPILEMFGLIDYFEFLSGGDVGIQKGTQIKALLDEKHICTNWIMIGDRKHDLIAANENGLPSAGVLWGYGSHEELSAHAPNYVLEKTEDLLML
ncbi:MAG: HAD hydrolase-like protein [Alphaproteobacteria bacterium]